MRVQTSEEDLLGLYVGRHVSVDDLDVSPDRVANILRHAVTPASLSELMGHDGAAELGKMVEDEHAESPFDFAASTGISGEVSTMRDGLDEREREILKLRFGASTAGGRTRSRSSVLTSTSRRAGAPDRGKAMSKLRHPAAGHDISF